MKTIVKALLKQTPYRISGSGALNRFDAIEEVLGALKLRGFAPKAIVDGGANVGNFARMARRVFPAAKIHLVEPQPACQEALRKLVRETRAVLHATALVGPGFKGTTVLLATTPNAVNTGAFIAAERDADDALQAVAVPTATLDSLLESELGNAAPLFLKLDLQGYELQALAGAERTLAETEIILTEVSFFGQGDEPAIFEIMAWLDRKGFELYDIAAISARARDGRARQADFVFVRRTSALSMDTTWS